MNLAPVAVHSDIPGNRTFGPIGEAEYGHDVETVWTGAFPGGRRRHRDLQTLTGSDLF